MATNPRKKQKSQTDTKDFVVAVFAEDADQAEYYQTLLKANDIPAVIKEQNEQPVDANQPAVMVPEEFLDEAHVVIESQDAYGDFYDLTSVEEDNEDSDNFDGDFFDDEND